VEWRSFLLQDPQSQGSTPLVPTIKGLMDVCIHALQVYFTGLISLALDRRPEYVDFGRYFVERGNVRQFADRNAWREVIFSHLGDSPELLMERLWQCVEANHEGRTAQPLDVV